MLSLLLLLSVPGPDSVAVVANSNLPESVALAERYRAARSIPHQQVCLLDLPEVITIDIADYRTQFDAPLQACLGDRADEIEAVVLVRGVPLRVNVDGMRASLAATLAIWRSEVGGAPVLGEAPGQPGNCGNNPCTAARWQNPFTQGVFEAGFERQVGAVLYRPLIVTMLHGYSYEAAGRLIASATTAEALGPGQGDFLLMEGRDGARGVLDVEYPGVLAGLPAEIRAEQVPFETDLTGRTLSAFVTGTAVLGDTIEGNTFLPGTIVDNLTSFGAVPDNFDPNATERQVSIARWVDMGVAGAHGTTDEPLNNCFPSRRFLIDYAEGGTLGEAYFRHFPFVYWRNLVLGDPMAAPYAVRPEVVIEGATEPIFGSAAMTITATHPERIERMRMFINGELFLEAFRGELSGCVDLPEGEVDILVVAQADDGAHQPKGWASQTVNVMPGPSDCSPPPMPDAGFVDSGVVDSGADTGVSVDTGVERPQPEPEMDEGCGCSTSTPTGGSTLGSLLLLLLWTLHVRRRPAASRLPRA